MVGSWAPKVLASFLLWSRHFSAMADVELFDWYNPVVLMLKDDINLLVLWNVGSSSATCTTA